MAVKFYANVLNVIDTTSATGKTTVVQLGIKTSADAAAMPYNGNLSIDISGSSADQTFYRAKVGKSVEISIDPNTAVVV